MSFDEKRNALAMLDLRIEATDRREGGDGHLAGSLPLTGVGVSASRS